MAYFGRADKARQYFIDLGFQPFERQTSADFLVAGELWILDLNIFTYLCKLNISTLVTEQSMRMHMLRPGFEARAPRTAEEFAKRFLDSPAGEANFEDIDAYRAEFVGKPERALAYEQSARADHASTLNKRSPYMISLPMQLRAIARRRVKIVKGDIGTHIAILMYALTRSAEVP